MRKLAGYTFKELSELSGVSITGIHNIENNDTKSPTLTTAYALAKALNTSVYVLWPDNSSKPKGAK